MDTYANKLPVEELVSEVDQVMVTLGYSTGSMRHFREAWNVLKKYAKKNNQSYLTNELGMTMLKEHYGIEMYSTNLSGYRNHIRRSVMLLLEYQVSGRIVKRQPQNDHAFPPGFRELGEAFIESLSLNLGLRHGTLRNNHSVLEHFFSFATTRNAKTPQDIDIPIINAYFKTLAGYSKSYISGQLRILSRFFAFGYKEGAITNQFQWPTVTVFQDRKIPEYYTADEIMRLLAAIDRANPRGKRDYAMVLLATRYGLRVSDIKALEFPNVDFVKNEISIVQQKTDKPLKLSLLPEVGWAIIDYIRNGRPKSDCPNIFICHVAPYQSFGSNDNLAYIISVYARAAGIKNEKKKKCSFHMLRYSLASELLEKNIPLTTISSILGHSQMNTTAKYTQLDFQKLRVCALEVPV